MKIKTVSLSFEPHTNFRLKNILCMTLNSYVCYYKLNVYFSYMIKNTLILIAFILFINKTYSQNIITTIAGNGTLGYSGDGAAATAAELSYPENQIFDVAGNMYIADSYNNVIRKVTTSGIITTIAGTGFGAGSGSGGFSGDGGQATSAELWNPLNMVFDNSGNLYFTDYNNNRVRMINTAGIIMTIAGGGTCSGTYCGDGGQATAAKLDLPWGLAIDIAGNLYIADEQNNVVRRVNTAGIISTVVGNGHGAGMGTGGYSGDGGQATAAELFDPVGLTFDNTGNLYIADLSNDVIRKVTTSGIISTYAGGGTCGNYCGDGGQATAAALNEPIGVVCDAFDNLYIGDDANNVIRKVSTTGIITTIAGNGTGGYSGDGGTATTAELRMPTGISFDNYGNLYIADQENGCIRKISNVATTDIEQVSDIRYQVSVFPNPASNNLWVTCSGITGIIGQANIIMYDMLGNVVKQQSIATEQSTIDVSDLQDGMYVIEINNPQYQTKQKIIINK
jgi:type IX secretion system substrate protein